MKRWMGFVVCFLLAAVGLVPIPSETLAQPVVVGRVYHIEGELLRYVPADKDWVAVVKDAPFGNEDTLFSGTEGMAELIIPNGTWVRVGYSTQVQFIYLDGEMSEIDVGSGMARFYNKSSSNVVIKATSPFGYVLADPGAAFDYYVGENSVEVIPVEGKVTFIHSGTEAKYDVAEGGPSVLADAKQVASGDGYVEPSWERWNGIREEFWAGRTKVRSRSVEYLPPALQEEAAVLEENGRWEKVNYEGTERVFWRPANVAVGWAPFTVGRWTEWYGDQTWIPAEPFGYMTHHYGNWVMVGSAWYWAPPVVGVRVGVPLLDVGFAWTPGRVSWIHTDTYVGWVPLAPREVYYSNHPWGGHHSMVITSANIAQVNVNVRNFAYHGHAVVVNQSNFYSVNNYTSVRVTNINNTTIINNYHGAPVINHTVIRNYDGMRDRHHFTNVVVREKPHVTVVNRIQHNTTIIREGRHERPSVMHERVKTFREGRVQRDVRIDAPRMTNQIVPARDVNRPRSEMKFEQRDVRGRGDRREGVGRDVGRPGRQDQPGGGPERVRPPRGDQQDKLGQPGGGPERVRPPRGDQQDKLGQPGGGPERVRPPRGDQQDKLGQPGGGPERVRPPRGDQQDKLGQPGGGPERVRPPRGDQQDKLGQPGGGPERVRPPRGDQQDKLGQPGGGPERIKLGRGDQQDKLGQPGGGPERIKPGRGDQQDKPGQPGGGPERVRPPRGDQQDKPGQPGGGPEKIKPGRGDQQDKPGQPGGGPERIKPGRGGQQDKPGQPGGGPERVKPQRQPQNQPPQAAPQGGGAGGAPEKMKPQRQPQNQPPQTAPQGGGAGGAPEKMKPQRQPQNQPPQTAPQGGGAGGAPEKMKPQRQPQNQPPQTAPQGGGAGGAPEKMKPQRQPQNQPPQTAPQGGGAGGAPEKMKPQRQPQNQPPQTAPQGGGAGGAPEKMKPQRQPQNQPPQTAPQGGGAGGAPEKVKPGRGGQQEKPGQQGKPGTGAGAEKPRGARQAKPGQADQQGQQEKPK